jgi:hypothetical protein
VIWEPFLLALVLGIMISAGLYFAYLWPSVEPAEPSAPAVPDDKPPSTGPAEAPDDAAGSPP